MMLPQESQKSKPSKQPFLGADANGRIEAFEIKDDAQRTGTEIWAIQKQKSTLPPDQERLPNFAANTNANFRFVHAHNKTVTRPFVCHV